MTKRRRAGVLAEALEQRALLAGVGSAFRSIDGSGNNLSNPTWGTPGSALARVAPPQYADGISTPAGPSRMGARELSNQVFMQHLPEDIFNAEGMSAFVYGWGQFIDHDLSLTNTASPAEPFDIPVPTGDPDFDPFYTGTQVIGLNRSRTVPGTGTSAANPRKQPNNITAWLDGSNIYGSDAIRAAALRTLEGGLLKTSHDGEQLPYNTFGLENQTAGGPASSYFIAGDVRGNENSELTSIHVLFLREHNRLANLIADDHPTWTDEQIYQQARRLVIGELQQITYNEFLPSFLSHALPAYSGYKPNVDPQVASEFSAAAFRFGHSIVGDDVQFFDDDAQTTLPDLKVRDTFFQPYQQLDGGTDGLLKYLSAVSSQEMDQHLVNGIRNFLFGAPGAGGFDLGALDVQRGRDHGLADLNSVRQSLGLPRYNSFAEMVSNPQLAFTLQTVYGDVDSVDLFIGGMCEQKPDGQVLGSTFDAIIADQFTRTRDGDRFWYQLDLTADEQQFISSLTLSELIKLNTSISVIQPNAFHFDIRTSGQVFNDANGNGLREKNEPALVNTLVYLFDGESIIDFTYTDVQGNYEMSQIQVGDYQVIAQGPAGWRQTASVPDNLHVNADIQFTDLNFGFLKAGGIQIPRGGNVGAFSSITPSDVNVSKLVDESLQLNL